MTSLQRRLDLPAHHFCFDKWNDSRDSHAQRLLYFLLSQSEQFAFIFNRFSLAGECLRQYSVIRPPEEPAISGAAHCAFEPGKEQQQRTPESGSSNQDFGFRIQRRSAKDTR